MPSEPSQEMRYRAALTDYRRADLDAAAQQAQLGSARSSYPWKQRFELLYAQVLLAKNQVDSASKILNSPGLRSAPDIGLRARRRMLEGNVFFKRAHFKEAHDALAESFTEASEASALDTQTEIQLLRAAIYWRERNLEAGYPFARSALDLAVKNKDTFHQAAALLNLGGFSIRRLRYDEAVPIFERVLILSEHSDAALLKSPALGNLALCYARLGDSERAIDARRQVIEFQRKAGLRSYLMESLGEMGTLYVLSDRPSEAVPWFRQAYEMALQTQSSAERALWSSNLAQGLAAAGQWDEAEKANGEALRLRSELHDPLGIAFGKLTSGHIRAGRRDHEGAIADFQEALATSSDSNLVWDAHAGLARVYRDSDRIALSRSHYEMALRAIESTTSDLLQTKYKITFLAHLIRFYQDYVRDLVHDGQDAEALEVADSTHARILSERMMSRQNAPRATSGVAQQVSRDFDGVVLCYWLSPAGSYLWALERGRIHRFDLPPAEKINSLVEAHTKFLVDRLGDPLRTSHFAAKELYDVLLRPAEHLIAKGANVILVPDGALNALNFETLVASEPKPHYWIEDAIISIAPSLHLLDGQGSLSERPASLLLIGDPVSADPEFPKLRFAAAEMAMIKRYFPTNAVLQRAGEAARPDSYQSANPAAFRLIHFTAHASANRESPLESAIVLSPDRGQFKLYSHDIAAKPLSADLVTISACRSAGARSYAGEGLVGFSWAFLKAGASNVIAGLWDVSDRSTADLMNELYYGVMEEKLAPPDALRQAKLKSLRSGGVGAKPFYWAPFQTYSRVYTSARSSRARTRTPTALREHPRRPTPSSVPKPGNVPRHKV